MIKEFIEIKREQLRLERENNILLKHIRYELKEIKNLMELSINNAVKTKNKVKKHGRRKR